MNQSHDVSGDMDGWPTNERGKPTQAAVFGVMHPTRGKCCELIWTGQFPDLEPATYWAAKKETQAVRKDKWIVASQVIWQHGLTPQQAVDAAYKQLEPEVDEAIKSADQGDEFTTGNEPIGDALGDDDDEADPLASLLTPPPATDVEVTWLTDDKEKEQS